MVDEKKIVQDMNIVFDNKKFFFVPTLLWLTIFVFLATFCFCFYFNSLEKVEHLIGIIFLTN